MVTTGWSLYGDAFFAFRTKWVVEAHEVFVTVRAFSNKAAGSSSSELLIL